MTAVPTVTSPEHTLAPRGVIVTGGGTGIGQAVARSFAENGDHVLIVGRTEHTLKETADGFPTISFLPVDVTDPDAADAVVSTALHRFGRVDVLVNSAAIATPAPLQHIDRKTAGHQLDLNLLAPVFLTQRAIEALARTRGTVVNLSSAGSLGRRAWPYFSLYGASKVAIEFLTRTWAVELAAQGIRVLAIASGVVETGMGLRMGSTSQEYARFLDDMKKITPLGRVGQPEEIAWWVRRLTDPEAGFATGTVIAVDGGLSLT